MSKTQFKNFFDMSHYLIESGIWASLGWSAKALYVVLSKAANRYTTKQRKEFFQSDHQLMLLSGIKDQKTLTKAKKELKQERLIGYRKQKKLRTVYSICL